MKKVLLTGASRGIGKAILDVLSSDEYEIFAPDRNELNLLDSDSVDRFCKKYKDLDIDIIINNAGINKINQIESISDEEISETLEINLISPIKLIRNFIPHMKNVKYGKIVNIASIWSVVSKEKRAIYSASKSGLNGLTKALSIELGCYNILVNSVSPGYTRTELTNLNNTTDEIANIEKLIPLGRMADPIEIANVVAFLVGETNSYITGQNIVIDGGYTSL